MLEHRKLVDVVDDPQPVLGVDQEVVRVLDQAPCPGQRPQLVRDVGGDLEPRTIRVRLPADDADPPTAPDPLVRQDLREGP